MHCRLYMHLIYFLAFKLKRNFSVHSLNTFNYFLFKWKCIYVISSGLYALLTHIRPKPRMLSFYKQLSISKVHRITPNWSVTIQCEGCPKYKALNTLQVPKVHPFHFTIAAVKIFHFIRFPIDIHVKSSKYHNFIKIL